MLLEYENMINCNKTIFSGKIRTHKKKNKGKKKVAGFEIGEDKVLKYIEEDEAQKTTLASDLKIKYALQRRGAARRWPGSCRSPGPRTG